MAAHVGEMVAERTDQKAEWSGGFGNSAREHQRGSQVLPGLGALCFKGKPNPASLGDREQSHGGGGGGFHVARASWRKLEVGDFTTRLTLGFGESGPLDA